MNPIDLNCDMGELPEAIEDGTQEELLRFVTSANIACGGHAGDAQTMRATIEQCLRANVAIGAHPGYEDPANFGRRELQLSLEEVAASVHKQLLALSKIADAGGARISHVKPHGALYNQAAHDTQLAAAIAEGVSRWLAACSISQMQNNSMVLVGLATSPMLEIFQQAGFSIAAEAFADRRYEPDGTLRSRKFKDALLHHPEDAAAQAVRIATQRSVIAANGAAIPLQAQTICLHGDTPGAPRIAAAVRQALQSAGVPVAPLLPL